MHPAARILMLGGWAVAVEHLPPTPLVLLAVATATAFLFLPLRTQLLRLLRRTRWLLLVLFLTYAYTLPGDPVWPTLNGASPSVDGVQQGLLRCGRLLLLLAALAGLLATTTRARLIYGLYVLARPLAALGFDRRAFAVRLGLTLEYVERAPKPVRWLDALREPLADAPLPARYVLETERWQARDTLVILAGLVLLGALLAWSA